MNINDMKLKNFYIHKDKIKIQHDSKQTLGLFIEQILPKSTLDENGTEIMLNAIDKDGLVDIFYLQNTNGISNNKESFIQQSENFTSTEENVDRYLYAHKATDSLASSDPIENDIYKLYIKSLVDNDIEVLNGLILPGDLPLFNGELFDMSFIRSYFGSKDKLILTIERTPDCLLIKYDRYADGSPNNILLEKYSDSFIDKVVPVRLIMSLTAGGGGGGTSNGIWKSGGGGAGGGTLICTIDLLAASKYTLEIAKGGIGGGDGKMAINANGMDGGNILLDAYPQGQENPVRIAEVYGGGGGKGGHQNISVDSGYGGSCKDPAKMDRQRKYIQHLYSAPGGTGGGVGLSGVGVNGTTITLGTNTFTSGFSRTYPTHSGGSGAKSGGGGASLLANGANGVTGVENGNNGKWGSGGSGGSWDLSSRPGGDGGPPVVAFYY